MRRQSGAMCLQFGRHTSVACRIVNTPRDSVQLIKAVLLIAAGGARDSQRADRLRHSEGNAGTCLQKLVGHHTVRPSVDGNDNTGSVS